MSNDPKLTPAFVVVFETYIGGELAQVQVPTSYDPTNSRTTRRAAEIVARQSFQELAGPNYKIGQKIKVVEIIKLKEGEAYVGH